MHAIKVARRRRHAEPRARRDLLEELERLLRPVHATETFADAQLGGGREPALPDESLDEIAATVERVQAEAMRLLAASEPAVALTLLEPVRLLLAAALRDAPTSFHLKVLLGYVFKTEAQATSDPDERDRYLGQAADVFGLVVEDAPRARITPGCASDARRPRQRDTIQTTDFPAQLPPARPGRRHQMTRRAKAHPARRRNGVGRPC